MAKTFKSWDVDQLVLLPPSIQELVPTGHLAHFVRDMGRDSLDLSAILKTYTEDRGFPPYDPVMMTALLLYAYCQGLYASRRIAKACEERVDFMAVTARQSPDFRTISDFRKRHLTALGELFTQVLKLCQAAGLVQLGHVALDGTTLKANASKHKAMSYGRMQKTEAELAATVQGWLQQAETLDAREDAEVGRGRRGDELPTGVADKQARLDTIRQAKAALEADAQAKAEATPPSPVAASPQRGRPPTRPPGVPHEKAQRNFTDPESRIMKTAEGFVQGYNAQAAVDAASQIIVAQQVTNASNDQQQLAPLVAQIKANTGRQAREVSADAGYCSEANLRELRRRHITGYVATGRQHHGQAAAVGPCQAQAGARTRAMRLKLRRGGYRSRYRLRKQTVEPVFGQIKQARGFRQVLLRGLANVTQEWSLVCLAHNLLKLAKALTR
ncbi:MAG TPA: IS1182 family transposase [Nitrospira sp.]|nr:IS1182 family transposase [Nitrospira sp.]